MPGGDVGATASQSEGLRVWLGSRHRRGGIGRADGGGGAVGRPDGGGGAVGRVHGVVGAVDRANGGVGAVGRAVRRVDRGGVCLTNVARTLDGQG